MRANERFVGIAALAGGALLAEVALTRILSVTLFHHLAFLIVSTALFGAGAAALAVALSLRLRTISTPSLATVGALIFAIGLPTTLLISQFIAFEPLELGRSKVELLRLAAIYLLYALPFFGAGLSISVLLDRYVAEAPSLYASDLLGAGAGSFVSLFAIGFAHGPGALMIASALGFVAASAFCIHTRPFVRLVPAAFALTAIITAPTIGRVFPLRISHAKVARTGEPFDQILRDKQRTTRTDWNSFARIDRVEFSPNNVRLIVDGGVAVVRVPVSGWRPTPSDATLPYDITAPKPRVLIIGSGAGWEVVEALSFGSGQVDAVEINPLISKYVPPDLLHEPRVRAIVDEGRSFLEQSEDRYDVIVMIHTISNAATAGGAMHLTEDFLLTAEAVDALLEHLTDRGVLFITRPEAQLPRLLATIAEAHQRLQREAEPRTIAWVEQAERMSFYAAVLTSNAPLTPAQAQAIRERLATRSRLAEVLGPDHAPNDPVLRAALGRARPAEPSRAERPLDEGQGPDEEFGLNLTPATDDRPFFHQRRRFRDLTWHDLSRATHAGQAARMALEEQPLAELSVLVLLVETTCIGLLFFAGPLLLGKRRRLAIAPSTAIVTAAYYACLGAGFMLIEIALVQNLGLLLGRPALSFATVFAGLLIGAGLGSHRAKRLSHAWLGPLLAALWVGVLALSLGALVHAALGWPAVLRVVAALLIVLPTGFLLGRPFPLGLLRTSAAGPHLIPWAFALNSLASIAGTVTALILATEVGFRGVLAIAAAGYLAATMAFPYLDGRRKLC
ncbi:MAG: hypothetical protein IPK13_20695 [Deltaproteobacteria bacterium]|nr:hypothetical protein [Deltaproteobacteria bacterium]